MKPSIGGYYTLPNGKKGRIMAVELCEKGYYLGHTSFSQWFNRHNLYKLRVSYLLDNGNIRSEVVYVDKKKRY